MPAKKPDVVVKYSICLASRPGRTEGLPWNAPADGELTKEQFKASFSPADYGITVESLTEFFGPECAVMSLQLRVQTRDLRWFRLVEFCLPDYRVPAELHSISQNA